MNGERRLIYATAEAVLALMQGLAAFRDRHDLVHAALMAARQAPEAAGAPEYPDAPLDDARVRECAARLLAAWERTYGLDHQDDLVGDSALFSGMARAALAYADETHANADRRAANRIAGLEMGCDELRDELAKASAINSDLIRDRDAARLRVAELDGQTKGMMEEINYFRDLAISRREENDTARARVADLEALNRGWQAKDGGGAPALPADLRDRLARILVGRECARPFTEEEGAVVNELIVWALKLPDAAPSIPEAVRERAREAVKDLPSSPHAEAMRSAFPTTATKYERAIAVLREIAQ